MASSGPQPPRQLLALSLVLSGLALTTLYFVIDQLLPSTGRAEFTYVPFKPEFHLFAAMRGFTFEQLVNHVLRVLLLGPGLLALSLGAARMLRHGTTPAWLGRLHVVAAGTSVAITAYVMLFVLRGRAITDDEVTYRTMARSFTRGALGEPSHPGQLLDLFEVPTRVGIAGKYLFGEPLVQMPGVLLSMPALGHLLLNALSLFALYKAVLLLWEDRRLAACSCSLLAISPTFMLCGATGQSQPTSLCCVLLSVLGYALAKREQPWLGGLLAGAAVGFGLSVRVQTLAPAGAVVGCAFVLLALRTRDVRSLVGFGLPCALGVAAIAGYNYLLSGDPLTLPWFLQGEVAERYGFTRVLRNKSFVHTPLGALQNLAVVAVRMNSWWLGWPLALLLLFRRSVLRHVYERGALLVWIALALIAFELGYYSTGVSDVGPIYHFELLPCLSVIAATCVLELWRARPELALAAVLVHVALGTGTFVWEQSARLGRLVQTVYAEPERVLASLPDHSLLLVEPSACQHSLRLGWVHRPFPLVTHDPDARVVTYGRPRGELADSFIAQFPGRQCFVLDHDPQFEPIVLPCSEARAQLARPFEEDGEAMCDRVLSTAEKLGLYAPRPGP
jgi:hypothetical protein